MSKKRIIITTVLLVLLVITGLVIKNSSPDYVRRAGDLTIIDIHNHDATTYEKSMSTWNWFGIDQIVLFGRISEPAAQETDQMAWEAFQAYPDKIYPFIAGVDINSEDGVAYVIDALEQGYYGLGELVAASTASPVASKVEWKAENPMDGFYPEIYEICADYKAPLLLHMDPPSAYNVIFALKEALNTYPDTIIIFAHANAYNTTMNIEALLEQYDNLYMDFFTGFTAYNSDSNQTLEDYADLISRYPTRFMVSSDSGYGLSYEEAYKSMYELFDLLDDDVVNMVASGNFQSLIDQQPITATQLETIERIANEKNLEVHSVEMNKHQANLWIIAHE